MAQHQVHLVREYALPVETVFAALADHNNLSKVLGIPVKRVRDGKSEPNGVGSVRKLGIGPLGIEETVTGLTPNRSIQYRISKGGAPIRNHSGELSFSPTAKGSRVEWTIDFDSAVPVVGSLVKLVLTKAIGLGLKRIG